ncbi:MAG: MerR family transcriptional regulator, partial [bacterium]
MSTNSARKFDFQNSASFSVSEASSYLKITPSTLRRLESDGKIKSDRLPNGYRQYKFGDLVNLKLILEQEKKKPAKRKYTPRETPAPVIQPVEATLPTAGIEAFSVPQIKILRHLAQAGVLLCLVLGVFGGFRYFSSVKTKQNKPQPATLSYRIIKDASEVLGDETKFDAYQIHINSASVFNQLATFTDGLTTNTATIGSILNLQTIDLTSETTLEKALDISGDVVSPAVGGLDNVIVSKIKGVPFGEIDPESDYILMGDGDAWQSVSTEEITALGVIATGTWEAEPVQTGYGGTGLTSYTTGDLIYASASNTLSNLLVGTEGQILTMYSG